MNPLASYHLLLALLPLTHAVQIIMSNPYSQGTPTEQIWNYVPPMTHCCAPLDLQYQGKGGWWRAESVVYNDLPAPSSTLIYGYELWHQQASCLGNAVLSTSTTRGVYKGMIGPRHTALGGAAYRLAGQVGSASHPAIMMYPEFIRFKGTYYEQTSEVLGVLTYESIDGDVLRMDDDFGNDADFAAAVDAVEKTNRPSTTKVQQPTPQALPNRSGPSSILVSPRQKGNPILNNVRSLPWEYSDIPADFVIGATTCSLFLSLKYHRLHPEYIYNRIRNLGHKYNLRVLLTMVDIQNHEEPLKELSKTSMVNNLTLILCWSAQEAGRYLELYKSYEHASPTSIKAHQSTTYRDKLVEFVTTPRSINTTDATSLISAFGSIRAAVNARPEEIGMIPGWGEKKVQRWCSTVNEPFRVRKAAKRGIGLHRDESSMVLPRQDSLFEETAEVTLQQQHRDRVASDTLAAIKPVSIRERSHASATPDAEKRPPKRLAEELAFGEPGDDDEEALLAAAEEEEQTTKNTASSVRTDKAPNSESTLNAGMAAALAKLRKE
ncbi:MAG: hypothetical protein Q9220_006187 [cf. Caloplaca sp. 1 TL-2023]